MDTVRPIPENLGAYMQWAKAQGVAGARDAHATHLTYVMGNEAGDLDSAVSAIGLTYALNHDQAYYVQKYGVPAGVYVPVLQTPRRYLGQRRENLHVLDKIGVPPEALLCVDELGDLRSPAFAPAANVSLGLVDHPQLGEAWGAGRRVDIVVDHHADDGAHADAPLRVVCPPGPDTVGSAASLVVRLLLAARGARPVPRALADALLSAVVLDTRNVRENTDPSCACSRTARARAATSSRTRPSCPIRPGRPPRRPVRRAPRRSLPRWRP